MCLNVTKDFILSFFFTYHVVSKFEKRVRVLNHICEQPIAIEIRKIES